MFKKKLNSCLWKYFRSLWKSGHDFTFYAKSGKSLLASRARGGCFLSGVWALKPCSMITRWFMNAKSTFTHRYTSLTSLISNVLINCVPQSLLCFFYSGCGGRGLCILLSDWLEGLGIALRIGSDWNWILIHCMKCVTLINLNPPSVKKCLWNMLAAVPLRLVYVNALLWLVNISMLVSTLLMSIWCDVIIVMISEPINGAANVTNIQTLFISKERGQNFSRAVLSVLRIAQRDGDVIKTMMSQSEILHSVNGSACFYFTSRPFWNREIGVFYPAKSTYCPPSD